MSSKTTHLIELKLDDQATTPLKSSTDQAAKLTEDMTKKIEVDFKRVALGAVAVSTGIVSFVTSLNDLEKAQLRANQASLNAEKAQRQVNELAKAGKQGTEQYRIAVEQMGLSQEKARLAQDSYNDRVLQFTANIAPQFITMGLGITSTLNGISIGGAALSTIMVTKVAAAFHAVRLASIAAFLTNPIGIAIIGITTLILLLTTNAFGLRDAFVNLGKIIFEFIDQHLKPLADLLRFLNDNVIQPIARTLGTTMPEETAKAGKAIDGLSSSFDPGLTTSIKNTKGAFGELLPAMSAIWEQSKNLQDITFGTVLTYKDEIKVIQLTAAEVQKLNQEYEKSITTKEKSIDVTKSLSKAQAELNQHFENARAKAFGAAQGNIDAFRARENIVARGNVDQIASLGLTQQELTSALLLSGVSAGQENAAIFTSQKFLNAVEEIARGKAFNVAAGRLGEFGVSTAGLRNEFLPNRSLGVKATGTDAIAIATAQRGDAERFQNAIIMLASKITQGLTEEQIRAIVREVMNGMSQTQNRFGGIVG